MDKLQLGCKPVWSSLRFNGINCVKFIISGWQSDYFIDKPVDKAQNIPIQFDMSNNKCPGGRNSIRSVRSCMVNHDCDYSFVVCGGLSCWLYTN